MERNELTIIVPCYNSIRYIDKCFDSLLNQTYKKFKIIFVDDCSTDGTLNKIIKFCNEHKNASYLENKKNSGAGYSRNKCLENVDTAYVTFIDSDDYYEMDYIEKMFNSIKDDKADISICDIFLKYDQVGPYNVNTLVSCCEDELTKNNYIVNGLAASPCNKIFKTDLFKDNKFAEGIINEDIPCIITCLIRCKKIVYVGYTHYNYIQHNKSVQNSALSIKKLDIFKSINLLKKRNPNIINENYWDGIVFNQIILLLFYIVPKEKSSRNRIKFLKEYSRLSKDYFLNKNKYLSIFYQTQSVLHIKYYNLMLKLISNGHYQLVNAMIDSYKLYKKHFTKCVLKNQYDINMLIDVAKKKKDVKNISVIIPNYNYAKFMYQRIYSILNQKYGIRELILLDDKSNDNSVEMIKKIQQKLSKYINIKVIINEKNSGSPFAQWKKGIESSTSKYVWIAEADDYCADTFLKKIFDLIDTDDNVAIAYANTAFINIAGFIIQKSVVPDIDIQLTGHWNNDFITEGIEEINKYSYLNCTIANVSSAIFDRKSALKSLDSVSDFKQAGDWLFYLNIMKQGKVAFVSEPLNYYRIHGSNATTVNKKQLQFDEIKKIHTILDNEYHLTDIQKEKINERYNFLIKKWKVK